VNRFGADGQWYPITSRAYWDELAPLKENPDDFDYVETGGTWPDGNPKKKKVLKPNATGKLILDTSGNWGKMPKVMLAKCAEADALRKGWPEDLGNLYISEEMDQANLIDLTATEIVDEEERQKRNALLGGPGILITFEFTEGAQSVPYGEFADKCLEFIRQTDDASTVEHWREFNREALRQFWGHSKGDALELKTQIDNRISELTKDAA